MFTTFFHYIYLLIPFTYSLIYLFIFYLSIDWLIVYWLIDWLTDWLIDLLVSLFVCLFLYSFIHLFIYSFNLIDISIYRYIERFLYIWMCPPSYHNNGFVFCTWVHDVHWYVIGYTRCTVLWSKSLTVRALNSQSEPHL